MVIAGASAADELDLGTWEGTVLGHADSDAVVLPVGTGVAKRG